MIQIVTDTTCGIPIAELKSLGITVLPQIVVFGNRSYRDDYEINTAAFLDKLESSPKLPGTAAPPPSLYQPIFAEYLEQGDDILVLAPSKKTSGTYRNAMVASEEFNTDRIHVLDTQTIAGGLGTLVLKAREWANAGLRLPEIEQEVIEMAKREHVFCVLDTLEYLHKGGRIGGASKLLGGLLQIKPILTLKEGEAQPYDKVRTSRQAFLTLELLNSALLQNNPEPYLTVSHCRAETEASALAQKLSARHHLTQVPIYTVPPAIVVHTGPGALSTSVFAAA